MPVKYIIITIHVPKNKQEYNNKQQNNKTHYKTQTVKPKAVTDKS